MDSPEAGDAFYLKGPSDRLEDAKYSPKLVQPTLKERINNEQK